MLLLAIAAALLAQTASDGSALQTYILHYNADPRPLRVLADPAEVEKIRFDALVDEPWSRTDRWESIQRITLRPDGVEREESALREAWLNAEWPKHGGVQVITRSGQRIWVLKEEQVWADKAQAIARAAYVAPVESEVDPELPAESSLAGPGAATLWAPHVAVVGGAVALAAGVCFLLLRKQERWQPLNSGSPTPRKR